MNLKKYLLLLLLSAFYCHAQNPVLIGYWQNWNDSNAPYIELDQIDSRYNIICVSFAVPTSPSDMHMVFTSDGVSEATLISQIQILHNQGKKILLSIGGATTSVSFTDNAQRDAFITSMGDILNLYHFDGIDIDIEHGNSILAQGTIANPTSPDSVSLIEAIDQIKINYLTHFNTRMMLTFAPETAYVQGGMSAYGGIWGGYLPVLDHFRNDIDFIHVQLYNSGSMYGIDGAIYNQGTADFIIAMTEAMVQGFNTAGGNFAGFPANKIVVGLPACPSAAGGGFTPAAVVESAVKYLLGSGPKPGIYTLSQTAGYPNLGGMMTWSVNWDKVSTCNSTPYEYAANFITIFGSLLTVKNPTAGDTFSVAPNPVNDELKLEGISEGIPYEIVNIYGQVVQHGNSDEIISVKNLSGGIYFLKCGGSVKKFIKL